jgi:hypothetical protein
MAPPKMGLCYRQISPADLQPSKEAYFIDNMNHEDEIFLIVISYVNLLSLIMEHTWN